MDNIRGVSLLDSQTIAAPNSRQRAAAESAKPRRSRAIVLTRVDRRTALGKRIAELTAIYIAALGSDGALSEMKRLRIGEAAQLKALAELARGNYMRNGEGNLDDIVRIERKASAAERALGIVESSKLSGRWRAVASLPRGASASCGLSREGARARIRLRQ
jgi:hypothetical protein